MAKVWPPLPLLPSYANVRLLWASPPIAYVLTSTWSHPPATSGKIMPINNSTEKESIAFERQESDHSKMFMKRQWKSSYKALKYDESTIDQMCYKWTLENSWKRVTFLFCKRTWVCQPLSLVRKHTLFARPSFPFVLTYYMNLLH